MDIDIYTQARWFRYIGRETVELENKSAKLFLKGRAVYGVVKKKDKFFVVGEPTYQLLEFFPVTRGVLDLIIQSSKPYMGKILEKSVEPGKRTLDENFPNEDTNTEPVPAEQQEPEIVRPRIQGSVPVELVRLTENRLVRFGPIMPPTDRVFNMVEKSIAYLGVKARFKKPVTIAVTNSAGTCMLGRPNPKRGSMDTYIVLNLSQLQRLFGTITVQGLAQVITHELAHYTMDYKVMKQTDLLKFKKLIASKSMHKDQFNHPGYSYPWWHEAWAILCEAMVHGQSARGFSTPLGWEIAEKYFVNQYLKNGEYTGTTKSF